MSNEKTTISNPMEDETALAKVRERIAAATRGIRDALGDFRALKRRLGAAGAEGLLLVHCKDRVSAAGHAQWRIDQVGAIEADTKIAKKDLGELDELAWALHAALPDLHADLLDPQQSLGLPEGKAIEVAAASNDPLPDDVTYEEAVRFLAQEDAAGGVEPRTDIESLRKDLEGDDIPEPQLRGLLEIYGAEYKRCAVPQIVADAVPELQALAKETDQAQGGAEDWVPPDEWIRTARSAGAEDAASGAAKLTTGRYVLARVVTEDQLGQLSKERRKDAERVLKAAYGEGYRSYVKPDTQEDKPNLVQEGELVTRARAFGDRH